MDACGSLVFAVPFSALFGALNGSVCQLGCAGKTRSSQAPRTPLYAFCPRIQIASLLPTAAVRRNSEAKQGGVGSR